MAANTLILDGTAVFAAGSSHGATQIVAVPRPSTTVGRYVLVAYNPSPEAAVNIQFRTIETIGGNPVPVSLGKATRVPASTVEGIALEVDDLFSGDSATITVTLLGNARSDLTVTLRLREATASALSTGSTPISIVSSGSLTSRSGTITTGGTAQVAMALNASRKYVSIENPASPLLSPQRDLWYSWTGTAVINGAGSHLLQPGESVVSVGFAMINALSIIGATTGQPFTAEES